MQLFIFHLLILIAVVSGAPVKSPEDQTHNQHQDPVVGNDGVEEILTEITIEEGNEKPKPPKKISCGFRFELKENCKEDLINTLKKEDGKFEALTNIMCDCKVEIEIKRGSKVSVVANGFHKVFMDKKTQSLEERMEISYKEFMKNMSPEEIEELKTYFVNFNPSVEGKSVSVDDGKLTVAFKYNK